MKRTLFHGRNLAALALSLGIVGCGGAGIQEGMPSDTTPAVTLDPKMTDMSGRSFKDTSTLKAKAAAAAKADAAAAPADEKK